jgi:glycosyltransferase involved in cell wall biosynthesis
MGAAEQGELGEIQHPDLPSFMAQYRCLFNPIRYTSLGLAVCEAMMLGLPVVGLATTEMATVINNGVNGYVSNDLTDLIQQIRRLVDDHDEAARLGRAARDYAQEHFGIQRFARDWEAVIEEAMGRRPTVDVLDRKGAA